VNLTDNQSGVSEALGSVLLIAIITAAIAIIAVGIFSHQVPEKIPSVSMEIAVVNHSLMITHMGGDPLPKNDTSIIVDGTDLTGSFSMLNAAPWADLVVGDTLVYQVPESQAMPGTLMVMYTGGSSAQILQQWGSGAFSGGVTTPVTSQTTPSPPAISADFNGIPTSGYLPLAVQFTDSSTGPVDQWSWNFGDGNVSSLQNPLYTYPDAGNYTVSLTVTNITYSISSTATRVNYTNVQSFAEFVSNESVFVYGTKLHFEGNAINGENATIIVMGPLLSTELDGGAKINVSTIYVDGYVDLGASNIALGYQPEPGNSYINGYLISQSNLYGEINVAGDATLTGAKIHGNVSVNGDLTVDWWKPTFDPNSYIYYTGNLITPGGDDSRCIHVETLPAFTIPELPIPLPKSAAWYTENGYVSGGTLVSGMKIYSTTGYSSSDYPGANNVIIVAANGDITLSGGGKTITGVLFAPEGRVTLDAISTFEGVVIAKDGLYVLGGGNIVTFKNMDEYIADPADYPF